MSQAAPAWFQPYYTDQAIMKLQNKGFKLKNTTVGPSKVTGDSCYWRIAAAVAASLYKRGNNATPAGGDRTKISGTFETWQVYEEIFDDDLEKMTIDEQAVVTTSAAMALGRRFDLQIMTALAADQPNVSVTDTTNGMTLQAAMFMMEAAQSATEGEWQDGEWFCALPPRLWNQLLAYKQFSSADWVGPELPFTKRASARSWSGVNWFLGPSSWFPIPVANQADVFLWRRDAVGYATNYDVKNTIAWEQSLTAWTSNMRMAGTAKVLLPEGVIRGRFATDKAITPT